MSTTAHDIDAVVLDPVKAAFDGETIGDLGHTHFIGIGGAGMSVLAEMLREQGIEVSGSDREESAKTRRLQDLGIAVHIGQSSRNVAGAHTVVYSSAIKPDNPEILAAHRDGIRIVHRSDILALLMSAKQSVTIAGAHGKTTTSSLLAHILTMKGSGDLADPSFAIGGSIRQSDGTLSDGGHAGTGSVLVAEADESDGSFLKYHPTIAIITNAEADHLDHYGDQNHYREAFVTYAEHAQCQVIVCLDDEGALDVVHSLSPQVAARAIGYTTQATSFADIDDTHVVRITSEREQKGNGEERFTIRIPRGIFPGLESDDNQPDTPDNSGSNKQANDGYQPVGSPDIEVPVQLAIPGLHNARNATAAILAAIRLGMNAQDAANGASSFIGAARRFQVRGSEKGVTVIDDYAHHPTEIAALLDAARRRYPASTIRVLFQPHLFSRTKYFAQGFAQALAKADDVIVTGIYPARERQEDFPDTTPSTIVEEAANIVHTPQRQWIRAIEDMDTAAQMLVMRAHHGDVIFTVGAGDITTMGDVMIHALQAHRSSCEV
jgi:UDP-N-acetylmuramate--alanine ligase